MKTASLLVGLLALLGACASAPSGPVVPTPPTVEVCQFDSLVFTPEVIRFQARVAIHNQMRGPLEVSHVDWGADLHDNPLFDEDFTDLHPMRSRATQTVTFPFQISMKDIGNQVEDVLAEQGVRVRFRGTVHPVGFEPIAFEATRVLPLPKAPEIALDGVRGSPLEGDFTVFVSVRNRNDFPLTFSSVESFVALNGRKYDLLRTESFSQMDPGETGRIALTLRHPKGKTLGMLINVAKHGSTDFTVGGSISCRTPYGLILLPLELASS